MFTGIVEERARVLSVDAGDGLTRLTLVAAKAFDGMEVGDSVAVNGVCLTATAVRPGEVATEVMPETLRRTNLGSLSAGDRVNIERPMPASGRFDGHIVQGHVDAVVGITSVERDGDALLMTFELPAEIAPYVVEKGSITMDGVSLTVAGVGRATFHIALIPHTLDVTTLGEREPGDRVNLEADIIAKYVERMLERRR
jgi:riboflavin synthase